MMAELNRGIEAEDVARRENLDEFLGSLQAFVEGNREEGREEETFLTDFCKRFRSILIWIKQQKTSRK